jgi:hypothetical protein
LAHIFLFAGIGEALTLSLSQAELQRLFDQRMQGFRRKMQDECTQRIQNTMRLLRMLDAVRPCEACEQTGNKIDAAGRILTCTDCEGIGWLPRL